MSNFNWTDKDSVRWFILLSTGHEGPYSLESLTKLLDQKKIQKTVKVWAEGLDDSVSLMQAIDRCENSSVVLPPLPELPSLPDEDDLPPVPASEENREESIPELENLPLKQAKKVPAWIFIGLAALLMIYFASAGVLSKFESFSIRRLPKMTPKLHERILSENKFDGWNKKIFFKEYLPDDHSQIWLVTSGHQRCSVTATFQSMKDKLLSLKEEKVLFTSSGELSDHVLELSSFEFREGNKIIPGMYEVDLVASDCEWDSFVAKMMNGFQGPDSIYVARTKVVLFSKGASEFQTILDSLIKKKLAEEAKVNDQEQMFWQDLQQKLETLQAIALQIEQLLLDFVEKDPKGFNGGLKSMVDKYTRQFGSFLTTFVIENEKYFKNQDRGRLSSFKTNYELMVKASATKIGLESMRFIENFQKRKKAPTSAELKDYGKEIRTNFSVIKTEIAQKIIQVSEDRSK